jgi:hypothetical protein
MHKLPLALALQLAHPGIIFQVILCVYFFDFVFYFFVILFVCCRLEDGGINERNDSHGAV